MTQLKNRKLPAWIGSILFHAVLLLLILYWFSLPSVNRDAPGERAAVGTIFFQSGGGAQQAETSPTDVQVADSELPEQITDQTAQTVLTHTLAPGEDQGGGDPGTATAGELSDIHGGSVGAGDATTHVFGLGGTGRHFVYVFDRSASMDGRPMQAARAELIRSLNALDDSHQFNIIFFNNDLTRWQPRLVPATGQNRLSAVRFVEGITAIGGTLPREPLLAAIGHQPDVIFFLTDGVERYELTHAHLEQIRRANNQRTQINVIEFGGGFLSRPSPLLQQLAIENRGEHRFFRLQ